LGPSNWNGINITKNYLKVIGFEAESYAIVFTPTDFEGTPRPQGAKPDIGAYEFTLATKVKKSTGGISPRLLYPNPADQWLNIQEMADGNLLLFDAIGRAVSAKEWKKEGEALHTAHLPNGHYFLKSEKSDGFGVHHFMVQHECSGFNF